MGALFSSRLKSLNFVSLMLNSEIFKAAQSKLCHILTRPISTSVERMGLGQADDSKRLNDCKRQGADQPSTHAGWPVPLLFSTVSVENYGFSNILWMYITIWSLFLYVFFRMLYYMFALCSPYLEDNKVFIYLAI